MPPTVAADGDNMREIACHSKGETMHDPTMNRRRAEVARRVRGVALCWRVAMIKGWIAGAAARRCRGPAPSAAGGPDY